MVNSILLLGSNTLFLNSFKDYVITEKKKIKLFNIKDYEIISSNQKKIIGEINRLKPTLIFVCGGLSGGIIYNLKNYYKILNYNTELYQKIFNILKIAKTKKILFLSASCVYPKDKKKLKETDFLTGSLEITSINYSVTKILGHCFADSINKNVSIIIPATIFGKYSVKDIKNSHVINSFIEKFNSRKKIIELWGSGRPKREFIYIKDLISAILFICEKKINDKIINIGVQKDLSIKQLANTVAKVYNFKGKIKWNKNKPDGAMKKLLDSSKIYSYGWKPKYSLEKALREIKNDN